MHTGKMIQTGLEANGFTRYRAAKELKVSSSLVNLTCTRDNCNVKTLERYADLVGMSLWEFVKKYGDA